MDPALYNRITSYQLQIIRYEEPLVLVLGNFGNIANILIFTRRELRKNVCSWYFICLSITHLIPLDSFCLSRIIITSTGNNIFQYITSLCKLRAYLTEVSVLLSRYFLCLISIDRWMITSSNAWLRQRSTPRLSCWLIILGILFWTIYSLHAPVGYQTNPIECTPPFGSAYELFVSIQSIIMSLTPLFLMCAFSILTILNIRSRLYREIHSTQTKISTAIELQPTGITRSITTTQVSQTPREHLKRNLHLVRLSLLQVLLYLFLNAMWSILPLYSFIAGSKGVVTISQRMMNLVFGRIGLNLLFTYAAVSIHVFLFQ